MLETRYNRSVKPLSTFILNWYHAPLAVTDEPGRVHSGSSLLVTVTTGWRCSHSPRVSFLLSCETGLLANGMGLSFSRILADYLAAMTASDLLMKANVPPFETVGIRNSTCPIRLGFVAHQTLLRTAQ